MAGEDDKNRVAAWSRWLWSMPMAVRVLCLVMALAVAVVAVWILAATAYLLFQITWGVFFETQTANSSGPPTADPASRSAELRDYAVVFAGLVALSLAAWRNHALQKQADTAAKALKHSEEQSKREAIDGKRRRATEQFVKAVELLGEIRADGTPALEQRLGALYALERLARENQELHVQIMELLCAYIRQNAPARDCKDWPGAVVDRLSREGIASADIAEHPVFMAANAGVDFTVTELLEYRKTCRDQWVQTLEPPREDIRAVMEVIARRTDDQLAWERGTEAETGQRAVRPYALDLRRTNLRRLELPSAARLGGADFAGARLEGIVWPEANLQKTVFNDARMVCGRLLHAQLEGARLSGASLESAELILASLVSSIADRADLRCAYLVDASLDGTRARGADLANAYLGSATFIGTPHDPTDLSGASFEAADFTVAVLRHANLTSASGMDTLIKQVPFADGTVKLPAGIPWPPGWEAEPLGEDEFWARWLQAAQQRTDHISALLIRHRKRIPKTIARQFQTDDP